MKTWFIYLLVISLAFGASLQFGFFQDDYFHLLISQANHLIDVFKFFIPQPNKWVFFRPLSTQLYYYLFTSIWGLSKAPLAMHLFMLLLHTTNAYLVRQLALNFKQVSSRRATIIGLLYGIWGIHFMSLFYIGATQALLATFFSLLAILALHKHQLIPQLIFVIFALLSKELSIRLPIFLFFYLLLTQNSLKQAFKKTLPSIILVVSYLLLRLGWGISTPQEYTFVFNPLVTLATTMWYSLMSLGFPEYILNFGLSNGKVAFISFANSFGLISWLNLLGVLSLAILLLFVIYRTIKHSRSSLIYFLGLWLSSILPVIFLPSHRYAHYLDLATISLFIFLITTASKKAIYFFLALSFIIASSSIAIDYKTHWSVKRARIASYFTQQIKANQACNYDTWYLKGSSLALKESNYAVLWDNYPQTICHKSISVVYNEPLGSYYLLDLSESESLFK